ncbi:MAG: rhomboid family intramembrane serine protease [Dehalococcoidales bacterium]|nr:rhomboid family intramembrane serine protease [Dehalococcoidales bacterium]
MSYRVNFRGNDGFSLGPIGYIITINIILLIVTLIKPTLTNYLGLPSNMVGIVNPFYRIPGFLDQPWSILTSIFIHGSLWHLFTNMITLFFFGNYLIRLVGNKYFLLIYFIAGLFGGLIYMLLSDAGIAIGASGAVFGVAGALTVLRPKLKVMIIPIPVPIPLWASTLFGFVLLSLPIVNGIAWQAHLGGLVIGAVAGWLLKRSRRVYFY